MNWTEEEITIVLYEYCRNPFGQFSSTKPFVQELGQLIGRTPAAIVRKVGNLASFDPQMHSRGVKGLSHTSKLDEIIWKRYYNNWNQLAFDAENIKAKLSNKNLEEYLNIDLQDMPDGKSRIQLIKQRINQAFFRRTVLCSYNQQCCITGINNSALIEACHIIGWNSDEKNRTNPENGLCLNKLLHKAYDEHLLGITPDYVIIISDDFFGNKIESVDANTLHYFRNLNNQRIQLPYRFLPNKDLLATHYEDYCKRNF